MSTLKKPNNFENKIGGELLLKLTCSGQSQYHWDYNRADYNRIKLPLRFYKSPPPF